MIRRAFAVTCLLLLAACSGSSSGSDAPAAKKSACVKLDKATIDSIAEGLTKDATITRGYAIKLSKPEANLNYIAALEIKDATGKSTAMLAMGAAEEGGGPLIGADNYAELYLDGGADIKDGSPLKNAAKNAWLSNDGKEAAACL